MPNFKLKPEEKPDVAIIQNETDYEKDEATKNIDDDINNKKIVAVCACAAGIAHTYMARDRLKEAAGKLGLEIKIETRGAMVENILSDEDVKEARVVIIAADIDVDLSNFIGKRMLSVSTNEAIKDGVAVINEALENGKKFIGKGAKVGKLRIGKTKGNSLSKALMTALSFMIPITIAGGLLIAIPNALAITPDGGWAFPNSFTEAMWNFGHVGLLLMVPILSMFLAKAIGGKPAMAAGLIGGFFINDGVMMGKFSPVPLPTDIGSASGGFLGGLLVGFIVGYMCVGLRWINWPKSIKPVVGLMIIPVVSTFLTFLIVVYIIGGPITYIVGELYIGLNSLSHSAPWANILIGMLAAGLIAVDLGGPINKTTMLVAQAIFIDTLTKNDPNFIMMSATQVAISIPPLGMWLSTVLFPHKFTTVEKTAGTAALPMGLVGISEGALPFAFEKPWKVIPCCILGSITAGAIVTAGNMQFYGGLGSPLGGWIGVVNNSYYGFAWFGTVLLGTLITGVTFGFWTEKNPQANAEYIEKKLAKKQNYIDLNLNTRTLVARYESKIMMKKTKTSAIYASNPKNWIKRPE